MKFYGTEVLIEYLISELDRTSKNEDEKENGDVDEGVDENEVVGCKIEFRFVDKYRKFSEPSGPTTIVQRQVRMSREQINQVVPTPPAFSGLENDQEFISQPCDRERSQQPRHCAGRKFHLLRRMR